MNGCGVGASSASVDADAVRTMVEDSARVRGRHGAAVRLAVKFERVNHQSCTSVHDLVCDCTAAFVPPRG